MAGAGNTSHLILQTYYFHLIITGPETLINALFASKEANFMNVMQAILFLLLLHDYETCLVILAAVQNATKKLSSTLTL